MDQAYPPPPPSGPYGQPPPPPSIPPPPPPSSAAYYPQPPSQSPGLLPNPPPLPPPLPQKRPPATQYRDHRYNGSEEDLEVQMTNSTTLYVGNLSFFTTEEQIYELFSRAGEIKRIIMGLDRFKKTPCGFCFAEYYTREDAFACLRFINGTRLDDRTIRTDWDVGFSEGRQYGRGKSGGQVRDEYRTDFDPGRGGYGKQKQLELEAMEKRRIAVTYLENLSEIPVGGDFTTGPAGQQRKRARPPSFSGQLPSTLPLPLPNQGGPVIQGTPDDSLPPAKRTRDDENPRFRRERSGKESDEDEE